MSDEERARILRMVAEGQLSPEEAADLLEAVQPVREAVTEPPPRPSRGHQEVNIGMRNRRGRTLVIYVKEGDENKVNIRIPLGLARVAEKFMPRQAQVYLSRYEIDLPQFLHDVGDAEGGTLLDVKEGENRVLIGVE